MDEWHCFKDKVKMEEASVALSYMQIKQNVPGLKCPVCGVEYITEKIATGVVANAESLFETK
jgi:hypothetical protein